jgi:hypothetical protein
MQKKHITFYVFINTNYIKSALIRINTEYGAGNYLESTGICLLIDSSSDIKVSVRTIPEIF